MAEKTTIKPETYILKALIGERFSENFPFLGAGQEKDNLALRDC